MQLQVIGIHRLDGALMYPEKSLGEASLLKVVTLKKNALNFAKETQVLRDVRLSTKRAMICAQHTLEI